MTLPVKVPRLPDPPDQYDPNYFASLLRTLELYMRAQNTAGPIVTTGVTIDNVPHYGYGLVAGNVYETNGTLHIVRASDIYFAAPASMTGRVGTVTTSP